MNTLDTRKLKRDSLFLVAMMRVEGRDLVHRVKVRNLSEGGMMAEGEDLRVGRGQLVSVELRNTGWVEGAIAWVEGNRCGVAFVDPVDPARVRAPAGTDEADKALTQPRRIFATQPQAGRLHRI